MASAGDKIKASTQDHLDIEDITDDLVIIKTGWVSMVMSTTAVNFDILSEAEQDATIYAYGALLNSLTFPLQVLIRSKKADITAYYQHLVEAERNQPNPDLRLQIKSYREFIQSTVQQKTILDKRFYLILHFSPLELGVKSFKKSDSHNAKGKAELIADAKSALAPKRDHIIKQTARLGLFSRQLTTQELIELYYDIYNPAPTGTQRVILDAASYTTPLVEPAVEVPTPAPEPVPIQAPDVRVAVVAEPTIESGAGQYAQPPVIANTGVAGEPILAQSAASPLVGEVPSPIATPQPIILPTSVTSAAGEGDVPPIVPAVTSVPGQSSQALNDLQEAIARASQMRGAVNAGIATVPVQNVVGGQKIG